jgi:hypothetical protein
MDILSDIELDVLIGKSKLIQKYNRAVDSESAYEILTEKLNVAAEQTEKTQQQKRQPKQSKEKSIFDTPAMRQVERTAASVITRSLLGALGLGGRRKRLW